MSKVMIMLLLVVLTAPSSLAHAASSHPSKQHSSKPHKLYRLQAVVGAYAAEPASSAPVLPPLPIPKAKFTEAQARSNPLAILQAFSADDLQITLDDANAQKPPDMLAANCYQALIAILRETVPSSLVPPGAGLFLSLQKARDSKSLNDALQSSSGSLALLNVACAPFVLDGQQTLILLGVKTGLVGK